MSNIQFSLMAGFRAVNQMQQNILRNAQGLLQPGYQSTKLQMGATPAGGTSHQAATPTRGALRGASTGAGTPIVTGEVIRFEQGRIEAGNGPTSLAIEGQGFFMLAENLNPGARTFLTRAGDFRYDAQGRLVNAQGLFVVGGNGTLTNPPTPVTNPGDGTVNLPSVSLAIVPAPGGLQISSYGPAIYQATASSGPLQPFANGHPKVGFVQANSLEFQDRLRMQGELQLDLSFASQTFKLLKDMLDNVNRMDDDAINTVK